MEDNWIVEMETEQGQGRHSTMGWLNWPPADLMVWFDSQSGHSGSDNGWIGLPSTASQRWLFMHQARDASGKMRNNGPLLLPSPPISPPPPLLWNSTCEEKLINIKQACLRLQLLGSFSCIFWCAAEEKPDKITLILHYHQI